MSGIFGKEAVAGAAWLLGLVGRGSSEWFKNMNPDSALAIKIVIGLGIFIALMWSTGGLTRDNAFEWLKSLGIALLLAMLIR